MTGVAPGMSRSDRILEALAAGPLWSWQIAGRQGCDTRVISSRLTALKRRGLVSRLSNRKWALGQARCCDKPCCSGVAAEQEVSGGLPTEEQTARVLAHAPLIPEALVPRIRPGLITRERAAEQEVEGD